MSKNYIESISDVSAALDLFMKMPLLKMPQRKVCAQAQGYGLALMMVFLMTSVLLVSSMVLLLAPNTAGFQQTLRETALTAAVADQALDLAQTDLLNQMKLGTIITTSYRFPTSGSNSITVPSYPGSGSSSAVGTYYVTVTSVRGYTLRLMAMVTVGSTTFSKTKLFQLHAPSHVLDTVPTAVAAYSTRLLSLNYNGSALRVHRPSDNTEQDIGFDSSGNLNSTTLATFLGSAANTAPLDSVSGAVAAYGLRKLRTAYAGSAIRVRRSLDNGQSDIGFNASGDLDTTALLNFVQTGSGYIVTWYDQSGNALNASQATTNYQPLIVNSGVINTLGSRPSIKFDGSSQYLQTASSTSFPSGAGARTMNFVGQLNTTSYWYAAYEWGSTISSGASGLQIGSEVGMHGYGVDTYASMTTDTLPHIESVLYSGTAVSAYLDSTSVLSPTSVAYNTTANTSLIIGNSVDGHYMTGNESEVIIYGSALSGTSRSSLETNQNNYFIKGCGTVSVWYDQSGNARNATQSTVTNQPSICTGPLTPMGSRATLQFNGNNTYLSTATSTAFPSSNAARTMNVVERSNDVSNWYVGTTWGSSSNQAASGLIVAGDIGFHGYGYDFAYPITADTNPHVVTTTYDGSVVRGYYDSIYKFYSTSVTYNTTANTSLLIGRGIDGHYLPGCESEVLIYARVLDSISQQAMENSQLAYY